MKKLLSLALFSFMMIFMLTGCCAYEIVCTTTGDNMTFNIHRTFGYSTEIQAGGGWEVFGHDFTKVQELLDANINAINIGTQSVLTSTLNKGTVFENEYDLGQISVLFTDDYDSANDIFSTAVQVKINSGLDAEGLYKKYGNSIDEWVGDDVDRYRNGNQNVRDEIVDKWMPQVKMIFNFVSPVVAQRGTKYVTVSGNSAIINIGQMMQDNGGEVIIYTTPFDINKDATYLFDDDTNPKIDDYEQDDKGFDDVDSDAWYAESVQYCVDKGIMNGYGDGTFGPNDPITVAQLCQIMFNNGVEDEFLYDIYNIDHWAKTAVGWCTYRDLVLDSDVMQDGKVTVDKINQSMTREQAISSLAKFAGYKGNIPENGIYNIPDLMDINYKYRDNIELAYQYGITSGVDSAGKFSPLSPVTRAQVCQMFYNMNW